MGALALINDAGVALAERYPQSHSVQRRRSVGRQGLIAMAFVIAGAWCGFWVNGDGDARWAADFSLRVEGFVNAFDDVPPNFD